MIMKKPYARSTITKKYRATGVPSDTIDQVKDYIDACANFYYLLEMDEAKRIILDCVDIIEEQFDTLLPFLARDIDLEGYIVRESEFFSDGTDDLYLISKEYLCVDNDECDFEEFWDNHDDPDYDGPMPLIEDWDRIPPLYHLREGKKLFVPDDLIHYSDPEYYESTPQTRALEAFIRPKLTKRSKKSIYTEEEYKTVIGHDLVMELVGFVKDPNIMPTAGLQKAVDLLTAFLDLDDKSFRRLADLFFDLSNHTRLPMNKGYTPRELSATRRGGPASISFGPGIQEALRSGDLDADELRQSVFAKSDWPSSVRSSMLSEIDKATLKPGEERWVGETVVKGTKVGPNDPCPCGSGKKYKKCCGRG